MTVKPTESPRMTSRELLVDVAGEAHQEHTVVKRTKAVAGVIVFWCSCNVKCEVAATSENDFALSLVPGESS